MIPSIDPNANTPERVRRNWQNLWNAVKWGIGPHKVWAGASNVITAATGGNVDFNVTDAVPDGFLSAGRGIRLRAAGVYSAPATGAWLYLFPRVGGMGPPAFDGFPVRAADGVPWMLDVAATWTRKDAANHYFRFNGLLASAGSGGLATVQFSGAGEQPVPVGSPAKVAASAAWGGTTASSHTVQMHSFLTELLY